MDDEVAISTFLDSRDPSAFAWIVREYQNRPKLQRRDDVDNQNGNITVVNGWGNNLGD
jgi:hypothetical protein